MTIGIITTLAFLTLIFAYLALAQPITKRTQQQPAPRRNLPYIASLQGGYDGGLDKGTSQAIKMGVKEIANLGSSNLTEDKRRDLETTLTKAGNPWRLTVEEYLASRYLLALIGAILGVVAYIGVKPFLPIDIPVIVFVALCALLGWFYTQSKYQAAISTREKILSKEIPDAIDLLVIAMESGMSFPPALSSVSGSLEPSILKDEFITLSKEIRSGKPVADSLRDFAERSPSQRTEDFARSVEQAHRLGSDLTDTLRRQSRRAREEYTALIDQKIAKVSSRVMVVLSIVIAPAALLVLTAQQLTAFSTGVI